MTRQLCLSAKKGLTLTLCIIVNRGPAHLLWAGRAHPAHAVRTIKRFILFWCALLRNVHLMVNFGKMHIERGKALREYGDRGK